MRRLALKTTFAGTRGGAGGGGPLLGVPRAARRLGGDLGRPRHAHLGALRRLVAQRLRPGRRKILSPPHTLLAAGMIAIQLGAMLLALPAQNRAAAGELRRLLGLAHLYAAGIVMLMFIPVRRTSSRTRRHASSSTSLMAAYPPSCSWRWRAPRALRWAATIAAAFYMLIVARWSGSSLSSRPGPAGTDHQSAGPHGAAGVPAAAGRCRAGDRSLPAAPGRRSGRMARRGADRCRLSSSSSWSTGTSPISCSRRRRATGSSPATATGTTAPRRRPAATSSGTGRIR